MSLKGKVAIVTGGNSGIGKAVALGLAKAGAGIVIDYIAHPEATEALDRRSPNWAAWQSASMPMSAALPICRALSMRQEIANVVVFLAGDGASYLTATTVFADGGIMQGSVGL